MFTRWFTYQQEQFPVIKNALLIAVFSVAAIGYSLVLRNGWTDRSPFHSLGLALLAFLSLFLFFLQIRIAEAFKALKLKANPKALKKDVADRDAQSSSRESSSRESSSRESSFTESVTLHDLQIIAIASGCIQLGLAWSVGFPLVVLLLLIWGYIGLLAKEFLVPNWLQSRPFVGLLTHAAITPLIAFYATACDWLVAGTRPPVGLLGFLAVSFFTSLVIKMGQKIRASREEVFGVTLDSVESYPTTWTRQQTVLAWLSAVWFMAISALLAAAQIQFLVPIAFMLLLLLTGSVVVAWRFLACPVTKWADGIELVSGLWVFLIYLGLGILPLLFQLG